MTYVIGEPCIDVLDRACVEECPVDCIYEGDRPLYIHPDECVDCGACEPVCPVEAIYYEDDLPTDLERYKDDNRGSSPSRCPAVTSRSARPGGAGKTGVIGADTSTGRLPPAPRDGDLAPRRPPCHEPAGPAAGFASGRAASGIV